MALPFPGKDAVPFTPLTAQFLDEMIANDEALAAGTGFNTGAIPTGAIADGAITSPKFAPVSSGTDANGWLVNDYGNFKLATKTVTPAAASKVRFEVSTQSSANLPVGVATFASLKGCWGEIGAATLSDFVSMTRNNTSAPNTAITYVYMYLGPTTASSYTVPVKFTVIW